MTSWETEDEAVMPRPAPLPTPQDTPYRTPSRASRRSRRSRSPPDPSGSPPLPSSDRTDKSSRRQSRDVATDETISILDPRRFTPTLHANLVSEILNLRRDQEEKLSFIENLESALHSARLEQDSLRDTLTETAKEGRSLKRQLALLEGGTSSALTELARDRDDAVDNAAETRKRLEASQKRIRDQEEQSQRVHEQWAREKNGWDDEKRKYECGMHTAESRLTLVLEELVALQLSHATLDAKSQLPHLDMDADESPKENDAVSIRTMSMTNSIRFSALNANPAGKMMGNSLADELNFDGDEEETDNDGRGSALSIRRDGTHSRESVLSRLHRRNQSIESLRRPGSVARGRVSPCNPVVWESLEDSVTPLASAPSQRVEQLSLIYVDAAVQYSPPPSPKLATTGLQLAGKTDRMTGMDAPPAGHFDLELEHIYRRGKLSRPLVIQAGAWSQHMVSVSSQTIEPPSPPGTPTSLMEEQPARFAVLPPPPIPMTSSSTQTDPIAPAPLLPLSVPSIAVHAPTSRPTTPCEPRLPQYFKNKGCQVSMTSSWISTDASMQTEEIRIDKRLARLPPHLQPSMISSRPPSPETELNADGRQFTPVPGNLPPRNPRRLASQRSLSDNRSSSPLSLSADEIQDLTLSQKLHISGPVTTMSKSSSSRRLQRISSALASLEGVTSDEADEFGDLDQSDSEFRTALSAPSIKPKSVASRSLKRQSSSSAAATIVTITSTATRTTTTRSSRTTTSPEPSASFKQETVRTARQATDISSGFSTLPEGRDTVGRKMSPKASSGRPFERVPSLGSGRASAMRKAAMIQNGITTHQQSRVRSLSPNFSDPSPPPFPIPTRASSRVVPISFSAPGDGQRSPTGGAGNDRWLRRTHGARPQRVNSIRKVRSATGLAAARSQKNQRVGARSPPPFSTSVERPESPSQPPPLPQNVVTNSRSRDTSGGAQSYQTQDTQVSSYTNATTVTDGSSNQTVGVVEAIAQTMVGEWMFKYVRRRKSFGMPELSGKDDNGSDRHKRWVWLAPYERSILWSNKQPSSGSALMGKSGRKLIIHSVLDVKDDNSGPKGSSLFNRSMLILTPQRALKFTAVSMERHYLWLTALSFLAHSSQAVPEMIAVALPQPEPELEIPPPKARRGGIRDSIRLTKSRGEVASHGSSTRSEAPSSQSGVPPLPSGVAPSQMSHWLNKDLPESFTAPPIHQYQQQQAHQQQAPVRQPQQRHRQDGQPHDHVREAAEAPFIPRFHERPVPTAIHGRKRSTTGTHVPPPLSFRGFSSPVMTSTLSTGSHGWSGGGLGTTRHQPTSSAAGNSIVTAASSEMFASVMSSGNKTWMSNVGGGGGGGGSVGLGMTSVGGTHRSSDASSRPSSKLMMDTIGTMRMEAFINPLAATGYSYDDPDEVRMWARRRSKELRRRRSHSGNRDRESNRYAHSGASGHGYYGGHGGGRGMDDDFFSREDPFREF